MRSGSSARRRSRGGKVEVSGRPPASEITSGRAVIAIRSRIAEERITRVRSREQVRVALQVARRLVGAAVGGEGRSAGGVVESSGSAIAPSVPQPPARGAAERPGDATERCDRAAPRYVRHVLRVRVGMGRCSLAVAVVMLPGSAIAAATPSTRARSAARPGHPLRAPATGAAARNAGDLAREADPRLRRQRLPRWRVPLPGLPLRRPRRQGGHVAIPAIRAPRATASRRRTAPTPTRPTPAYADNAADLVELRVKPLPSATAFRITLNTHEGPVARRDHDRDRRLAAAPRVPLRRQRERRRRSSSSPFTATHADLRDAATGQPVGAGAHR